ncbi:MAG: dephospho-CoA kinase [Candidatus Omnitrophica bacterium]|nr:dephospho-CoA kinase [Candidatus Omnitrophota bacterium]MDD5574277.1 dephospho-CoA kinase [Candidatus Omnitrophota bacterium]
MTKIGLTGGLGTGKTTVLKMFRALGAKTWDADDAVRRELNGDLALRRRIRAALGGSFFTAGRIDRRRLAREVFASPRKLAKLNALVHPAVKKRLLEFFRRNKKSRVLVAEVPLLFETDFYRLFDVRVCVTARRGMRSRRLMASRRYTPQDIAQRERHQLSLSRKIARCDMTIDNNGTRSETYRQVKKIMEEEKWKN